MIKYSPVSTAGKFDGLYICQFSFSVLHCGEARICNSFIYLLHLGKCLLNYLFNNYSYSQTKLLLFSIFLYLLLNLPSAGGKNVSLNKTWLSYMNNLVTQPFGAVLSNCKYITQKFCFHGKHRLLEYFRSNLSILRSLRHSSNSMQGVSISFKSPSYAKC